MADNPVQPRFRLMISRSIARWRLFNLSLAAKCRLLFGLAVLLIIAVTLSVPWYRMEQLVQQQNGREAQSLANDYIRFTVHRKHTGIDPKLLDYYLGGDSRRATPRPELIKLTGSLSRGTVPQDEFTQQAIEYFTANPKSVSPVSQSTADPDGRPVTQYLQAVRADKNCLMCHAQSVPKEKYLLNQLVGIVRIDIPANQTDQHLLWNRAAIVAAVVLASLCAIAVFYLITHWLILAPIDHLRQAAEQVASGRTDTRVNIQKGDEFEDLGRAFNQMLDHLEESQRKLQTINKSLDTKLTELAEANVSLHEANRVKSEFLGNVSHELRTPLNSIIGFAELLQNSEKLKDETKLQRYLVNILTSARALLTIINELLDLAKIEAGRIEVRIEKVATAAMCEDLCNFVKPLADKKQLALDMQLEERLPLMETDPGKLQQILFNLLSNAIKYTPEGGSVTLAAQTVAPEHIRISVSDTGPGIAENMLQVIFEKFRQIDGSASREHGGVGLGLAIAKELAAMLGGSISVASTVGQGTTFSVTLPLKAPADHVKIPLVNL